MILSRTSVFKFVHLWIILNEIIGSKQRYDNLRILFQYYRYIYDYKPNPDESTCESCFNTVDTFTFEFVQL